MSITPGFMVDRGQPVQLAVPSVEDVQEIYNPPSADFCKGWDKDKEIFAIGSNVYQGVVPEAYDSHRNMCLQAAWDCGPGNIWILPTRARLTYPFAPLYAIASLFGTERRAGRKADWLVWIDDDVLVPKDLIRQLRQDADPEKRPFVAAAGFDRKPPFRAGVWEAWQCGGATSRRQWVAGEPSRTGEVAMPTSGVHEVMYTGLCAAIFHRSWFDRVPQPWFATVPPMVDAADRLDHGTTPDGWLCTQCHVAGVPVHVTCNVKITHIGVPLNINYDSAKALRHVFPDQA